MMKTYRKDFSIENLNFKTSDNLSEVACYRHDVFMKTTQYESKQKEIDSIIKNIEKLNQTDKVNNLLGDLTDEIFNLENMSFDAAYRDGMADLMTSITLNKANIIDVEYVDYGQKGA